jgi:hypothetical protein
MNEMQGKGKIQHHKELNWKNSIIETRASNRDLMKY